VLVLGGFGGLAALVVPPAVCRHTPRPSVDRGKIIRARIVRTRSDRTLLGSTGLHRNTGLSCGYVLAKLVKREMHLMYFLR
jgi:hypothetical protein